MSEPLKFLCGRCLGTEQVLACERGHSKVACCHRLEELSGPCPACASEDAAKAAKAAAEKVAKEKAAKEKAAAEKAVAEQAARIAAEKSAREKVIDELVAKELRDAQSSSKEKK